MGGATLRESSPEPAHKRTCTDGQQQAFNALYQDVCYWSAPLNPISIPPSTGYAHQTETHERNLKHGRPMLLNGTARLVAALVAVVSGELCWHQHIGVSAPEPVSLN